MNCHSCEKALMQRTDVAGTGTLRRTRQQRSTLLPTHIIPETTSPAGSASQSVSLYLRKTGIVQDYPFESPSDSGLCLFPREFNHTLGGRAADTDVPLFRVLAVAIYRARCTSCLSPLPCLLVRISYCFSVRDYLLRGFIDYLR